MASPKGYERGRLIESYYNRTKKLRLASAPLTPENLYTSKGKILNEQFNWLYLSVCLGLRPQEVDNLKNKELWNIEETCNPKNLWVYQTKIVSLPHENRWKPIPILFDEQEFALRIIKSQKIQRPLVKTVHHYFGDGIDLYG